MKLSKKLLFGLFYFLFFANSIKAQNQDNILGEKRLSEFYSAGLNESDIDKRDSFYSACLNESDLDKRDSCFTQLRFSTLDAGLDSQYVYYSLSYIEDSLVLVNNFETIVIIEGLLTNKHFFNDPDRLAWGNMMLSLMYSFERNDLENLDKIEYYARQARAVNQPNKQYKYQALLNYYVNSRNDSLLIVVEELKQDYRNTYNFYLAHWFRVQKDYVKELQYALKTDQVNMISIAYLNNLLYDEIDSLKENYASIYDSRNPSYEFNMEVLNLKVAQSYLNRKEYKKAELLFQHTWKYFNRNEIANYEEMNLNLLIDLYKEWGKDDLLAETNNKLISSLQAKLDKRFESFVSQISLINSMQEAQRNADLQEEKLRKIKLENEKFEQKAIAVGVAILLLVSSIFVILISRNKISKYRLKASLDQMKLNQMVEDHEKKILEVTIEDEKQRMTQAMLNLSRKGEFAKELIVRLKEIEGIDDKSLTPLKIYISNEMQSDESLLEMESYTSQLDKSFFSKLKLQFPQLTDVDIKLCALIRMNLSNKQLGIIKNITSDSVKRSKTRLGKKMNLPSEITLSDFIRNI